VVQTRSAGFEAAAGEKLVEAARAEAFFMNCVSSRPFRSAGIFQKSWK